MPTRAFGDFYLKHKEFNNPKNLPKEMGYRTIDKFNGPYITHRPEIKIFTLTKEDKGFLLSSDGLYDELSISQVLKLYNENKDQHPLKIVNTLVGSALTHAADQHEMTVDSLKSLPPGKNKRNIHDDLTLVYINLSSQVG
jgi:pyruvate dehydrogenase phosphatase